MNGRTPDLPPPDARAPAAPPPLRAVARFDGTRAALYATPPAEARRLRVVLVTPVQMPRWLLPVVGLAAQHPGLQGAVVAVGGHPAPSPVPHLPKPFQNAAGHGF